MDNYQGIARKFRPQTFDEVVGQEVIVTTLINAIKYNRLAHAYLFCGSRGTGKTTLARLFAKALNCLSPLDSFEPCNECSSCKEITVGNSLDVLEIDGASNRSIDDIRKINDTVAYASSHGKFKIYIIDEVHMLTKEAFNALLKTLEEPPEKVKFIFATTEPHKVLPTILSRCQRFNLKRISVDAIIQKLTSVAQTLRRTISPEALRLIAQKAEGGLRDAESLLDQIFAYHDNAIEENDVATALGIVPKEIFFALDREGKQGNLAAAFSLSSQIFSEGKDLPFFIEGLLEHFRNVSVIKLSGKNVPFLNLSKDELEKYEASASYYSKEQLLSILDICLEAQQQIRFMPSIRIALESLLLRIMRTHQRIPIEVIVERLANLEQKLHELPENSLKNGPFESASMDKIIQKETTKQKGGFETAFEPPKPVELPRQTQANAAKTPIFSSSIEMPKPITVEAISAKKTADNAHISEDPTPTKEDIKGFAKPAPKEIQVKQMAEEQKNSLKPVISKKKQAQIDTLLQFAAVELEGRILKK